VRLRLLVPRGGRGRGLGGLAAAVAAVGLVAVLWGGDDDDVARDRPPAARSTPAPLPAVGSEEPRTRERPRATPSAAIARPARRGTLAIGITEPNANLVSADRDAPPPFDRWRDELGRLHPALYRLTIDWADVQPSRRRPADLDAPSNGCMRAAGPCAGYAGVRDQLRALASRQTTGGWEALVVITGTPRWAGRDRAGCMESSGGTRARPLGRAGLAAYRRLVADLLAAATAEGATLRWWSPWNEPNHPLFLAPQRAACAANAATVAVGPYVAMARALRNTLAAAPGDQRYVLGELAGLHLRSPRSTTIAEFIAGLPRDLVCGTTVWSQHGYLEGRDQLDDIEAGLRAHACRRRHAVWMTETGTGVAHSGAERGGSERRSCRHMHRKLEEWYEDRRVTAAFQYTFREDDLFPTGLVTTDLSAAYPVLRAWQAWGMERRPTPASPPPTRSGC
jgi:hypothetical protein